MSVINRQALLDEIEITSFEDYGDYITVRDLIAQFPSADRKTEPTQNQHIQSVESVGEDRKTEQTERSNKK